MTEHMTSSLRNGAPSGSPASYTSKEEITSLLRGTAPAAVTASGQSYVDLANAYDQAMTDLRRFAHDLANAWKGPASNAAQHHLRELFVAAFEISSRSSEVGNAVRTHGTSYLAWYQQSMPTPKSVEEARQWMQGANARATQTWNAIPADISTGLPSISTDRRFDYGSPSASVRTDGPGGTLPAEGSGTGHASGSASSHETGGGTRGPGVAPGSVLDGVSSDSSPGTGEAQQPGSLGGTDLAALGTSGGAGSLPGSGSSGGIGPAVGGGLGAGGGLPGGATGGGGGVTGGTTGAGPGLLPGAGGPGGAPAHGATGRTASAGRLGLPGVGYPGGSGRGGDHSKEHNRRTWLSEQDVWYDDREVAPRVIGEVTPEPTEPQKTSGDEPTEQEALLRRVLDRLERLEAREATAPPHAEEPRIEWTD
ncbi:WXG100 family type VII secretion target [Actinomadura bangladeshensis]|uniref:WXG100 family type VII secretion target n=1 Tax=Actinomadura bangladeshensis TaxID=453573 RepID=UPI00140457EF|nr:hypothetical protein [Actinomadura bangladeshensis]